MSYLIDGHNLIPKIPDLSLQSIDDEIELIVQLQEFCRIQRKQVEVYFDNSPPGQAQWRTYGQVTARFVRRGTTADQAIYTRLQQLGRAARNWTVVSSDQAVQRAARSLGAQVLKSEAFAGRLAIVRRASAAKPGQSEANSNTDDLQEWLRMFGVNGEDE